VSIGYKLNANGNNFFAGGKNQQTSPASA
jgi:hypothetical protein